MANKIKVEVVSAEKNIFSGEAVLVVLPGKSGEFGVMPRHTPFITLIRPGLVEITQEEGQEPVEIYVHGGIIEVQPDIVTVLADTAVHSDDFDEERLQKAIAEAKEQRKAISGSLEIAKLEAEMSMLTTQLKVLKRARKHG